MLGVSTFLWQTRRREKLFAFLSGCARLVTSAKEVEEKGEEKMSDRAYENIQGVLSYVVLLSGFIGFAFTLEYFNLLNAMDLSEFGKQFLPPFITGAWVIFALAIVAKIWGDLANVGFYRRIQVSNKLYNLAEKIDPRRK